MNAFGPPANIRSQILSYENGSEETVEISYGQYEENGLYNGGFETYPGIKQNG